jgi:hypothetical protein
VSEKILRRLEDGGTVEKSIDAIDQALAYQGDNQKFMEKGKLGSHVLGHYKGLYAAQTNRELMQFARERDQRRLLSAVNGEEK